MPRDSLLACALVALTCSVCCAQQPLHERIDQLIAAGFDGEVAPLTDDAAFFRRINLDLAGRIPTAKETREFLADTSPQKRRKIIERLLEAPEYAQAMTNLFDVMLMERRGDHAEWETFLRACFQQNKPWDRIVGEILKPNHEDESLRGAAYFYTRRLEKVGQNPTDYPGLTRDVGRLFLGVDLQCAECHDHLFIDDYKQRDFQGLLAVYKNVSIRRESFPAINETTMTDKLEFVSVLDEESGSTGPRIPFGKEFEIPQPPVEDAEEKKDKKRKPDPNDPPSFSALKLIAEALPSADNRLFRQNIANRLWFMMMGHGLVEPLDQFHAANQATHPQLLELLADELAAHDFDIKWLLQELALTETWQRSSRMPPGNDVPPRNSYRLGSQRRMTAEQLFWSTLQATGNLQRLAPADGSERSEELKELKSRFLDAFAGEPKEPAIDYTPAVKQALFVLNDAKLLELLTPNCGNLLERLSAMPDDEVADELFLSIFCRLPGDDERMIVRQQLQENKNNKIDVLKRLAWAMLTSMEFSVNH